MERRALTLWRPWTDAILYGGKRIENRPWKPWPSIIGRPIAIHAGKHYDTEGAESMRDEGLFDPPGPAESPLGIVGIATVVGYSVAGTLASIDPWFTGPFGWRLANVIALPEPVPCRGAQGLWVVPADVLARIREIL